MKLGSSFVETRLAELFGLWNPALSCQLVGKIQIDTKSSFRFTSQGAPKVEREIYVFAQGKAEALHSLASFISNCDSLLTPNILKQIVTLLSSLLYPFSLLFYLRSNIFVP